MTRQHQSALSRLGFRDPDKENPRHGLACEYLQEKMRPYAQASLARMFARKAEQVFDKHKQFCFNSLPIRCSEFLEDHRADWGHHWYATSYPPSGLRDDALAYVSERFNQWAANQISEAAELSSLITGPGSGAKGFLDVSFRGEFEEWYLTPDSIKRRFKRDGVETPDTLTWSVTDRPSMPTPWLTRNSKKWINPDCRFSFWGEVRIEPTAPELLLQQIEFYASNLPKNDMIWVLADFDLSDFKRMAQQQFPQLKCFQLGSNFEEWCQNRERPEIPEL